MSLITALLVDDHALFRDGLKALLERDGRFNVVEAANGREAVDLARETLPAIVIMDVMMPDLNGVEAARQILREHPSTRIIALSAASSPQTTSEMLRMGARGYVPKEAAFDELVSAIDHVLNGRTFISPSITSCLLETLHPGAPRRKILSGREREVLQLISEGNSTKQVALKLHISVKTVETHRRQLMEKLELFSIAELTKYALREGLTTVDR